MTRTTNNYRPALAAALLVLLATSNATPRPPGSTQSAEPVPRQAAAAARAGSITGRVVTDAGQPLEGAMVYVRGAGSPLAPRMATTDEDGRFSVDDLGDADYSVGASARGYFMPDAPAGEALTYRPGASVSVTLSKGGVITGKVLDARGEPVVGVNVRAIRARDAEGSSGSFGSEVSRQTDDRGVYRLFGLKPGAYVVAAGGGGKQTAQRDPYRNTALSYYPSETRDTAAEVKVAAGVETNGVDIRYRGESGHTVSGSFAGVPAGHRSSVSLALVHLGFDMTAASTTALPNNGAGSFAFHGISDGEYELTARSFDQSGAALVASQHVSVKGGSVEGLRVTLAPLGAIAGRVRVEPGGAGSEACKAAGEFATRDVVFTALPTGGPQGPGPSRVVAAGLIRNSPDEKGEFALINLPAGAYRVEARPPGDGWYVKSMTLQAAAAGSGPQFAPKLIDAGRHGLTLKSGERLTGLTVTFAHGAASLQGRVAPAAKASLPARARLHLVPAEEDAAGDVLRYVEVPLADDGSFTVKNVTPGRYLAVIEPAPDGGADARRATPAAWDAARRAKLRSDAAAAKLDVELRPCQQATGFAVPYTPAPPRATAAPGTAK